MRLFLTTDAVGGVWTYALDLAAGLAGRGVEVTLAVIGPPMSPAQREAAERIAGVEVIDTELPLDWTAESAGEVAAAARSLTRLADRRRSDLVHLNSPALAADAVFPAPVVGTCHSDLATWWAAVRTGEPPEDFGWRIDLLARGYRGCDALIAPSAAFARGTAERFGVAPVVVRNGRAPSPQVSAERDIGCIAAGRLWDEGKGAAILDAAAQRSGLPVLALGATRGPQGQGSPLPHLQTPGAVSDQAVRQTFARARVFVSAALYEPFGLGVLEAAQAGCALLLSDIPTFRELWDGAAHFTPPGDPRALADALRDLMDDEAQTTRLAMAARHRAADYGLDAFVEGTAAVYRQVLQAARVREAAA